VQERCSITKRKGGFAVINRFAVVVILLLAALLCMANSTAALAEPTELLEISGNGVANPIKLTMSQLRGMQQYRHVYSTVNTWPTKRWYVGEGVKLRELLSMAQIKKDAKIIILYSSDGYSINLTVKEILSDKRYYFPHLIDGGATIQGSAADAQEVEPILALLSAEGKQSLDDMNDMNALLFLCGQRAVTEQTNTLFLKYVNKIEVSLEAPPKWDNPRANITAGKVLSGTVVELNSERDDVDKVHYTTDGSTPDINSPIFNLSAKRWWGQRSGDLQEVNKPIELTKDTVIKAITIGPGKEDSEVVTFSYQIGTADEVARQSEPVGSPSAITLNRSQVDLKLGGAIELKALVAPENSTDKRIIWSSSNTGVAVVDNHGLVTAVGPGTAIISARIVKGNLAATCIIEVDREQIDGQTADSAVLSLKMDDVKDSAGSKVQEVNSQGRDERELVADSGTAQAKAQAPVDQEEVDANHVWLAAKDKSTLYPQMGKDIPLQTDNSTEKILEVTAKAVPVPAEPMNLHVAIDIILTTLFLSGIVKRYREYLKEGIR